MRVGNARPAIFSLHPSNEFTPEENYRKVKLKQPKNFGRVLCMDLFCYVICRASSYLTENAFCYQYVSNIKTRTAVQWCKSYRTAVQWCKSYRTNKYCAWTHCRRSYGVAGGKYSYL